MRETCFEAKIDELLAYPEHYFGESPSERWLLLCSSLSNYQIRLANFVIGNNRKWELVSALQKTIRRADKPTALKLISGFANMPEEYAYFLRRMCVIACEDVGPADDTLVKFVIACATIFSPKKMGGENHRLLCFLSEQMCDLPIRSRVYCSCESISLAAKNGTMPNLSTDDLEILSAIAKQKEIVQAAATVVHSWQKRNNWRAEGMMKFVGFSLPMEPEIINDPVPMSRTIFDLPSYCYDMHTRIGLAVLRRLVHGVGGAEAIRDLFVRNGTNSAHKAIWRSPVHG